MRSAMRELELLVARLTHDRDDQPVEQRRRAADHVDVPERDGVVAAGTERGAPRNQCRLGFGVAHAAKR